jgi:hypothetical protein
MKPLSKRAAKALDILRAGGLFASDPTYGGTYVSLYSVDGSQVDGFGRRGFANTALRELHAAGFEFIEYMDGNNIIRRLAVQTELFGAT